MVTFHFAKVKTAEILDGNGLIVKLESTNPVVPTFGNPASRSECCFRSFTSHKEILDLLLNSNIFPVRMLASVQKYLQEPSKTHIGESLTCIKAFGPPTNGLTG